MDKAEESAERERFFASASALTPLLGVEAGFAEFLVRTSDTRLGRRLFVRQARPEMRLLKRALKALGLSPSGMFLDVGANIGTTTIPALAIHGFASAVAIEPEANNVRLLKANLALNGLENRVQVVEAAASNTVGEAKLRLHGANSGGHRISDKGTVSVPLVTLDGLAEQGVLGPADVELMWLDVQGHEGHVLAGASSFLARVPLVLEYHPAGLQRAGGYELLHNALASKFAELIDLRSNASISDFVGLDRVLGSSSTDLLVVPR